MHHCLLCEQPLSGADVVIGLDAHSRTRYGEYSSRVIIHHYCMLKHLLHTDFIYTRITQEYKMKLMEELMKAINELGGTGNAN